jgi:hypothetical protein
VWTRVQESRHFPLIGRYCSSNGKVYARKDFLPRATRPNAVPQDRFGQATRHRLMARDDVVLGEQNVLQPDMINSR